MQYTKSTEQITITLLLLRTVLSQTVVLFESLNQPWNNWTNESCRYNASHLVIGYVMKAELCFHM